MAKNNFLTDKFTTTGGVASVAYGSSSLFYSVCDQIKNNSVSKTLDQQLPSHLVLDFVGTKDILVSIFSTGLRVEYAKDEELTDFIDIFSNGITEFSGIVCDIFLKNLNKVSNYSYEFSDIIEEALFETKSRYSSSSDIEINYDQAVSQIITEFDSQGYVLEDLKNIVLIALSNPRTKITYAPPDQIIRLSEQNSIGKDYRGVDRDLGTSSIANYYNNVGYNPSGGSIDSSVVLGYVGYPLAFLLGESLLEKDSFENYLTSSLTQVREVVSDPIYNLNLATVNLNN